MRERAGSQSLRGHTILSQAHSSVRVVAQDFQRESSGDAMYRSRLPILGGALAVALCAGIAHAGVLTVNSNADDTTPGDGLVTLREALVAAATGATTDLGQTASGDDTIDLSGVSGSLALHDSLPAIQTAVRLFGSASNRLTIDGDDGSNRHRLFFVDGGHLDIRHVDLANGLARGGNGGVCEQRSGCGGGGAGLGGIVFLNAGALSLTDVSLSHGEAAGGHGASRSTSLFGIGGGGGGGMTFDAGDPPSDGSFDGGAGAAGLPFDGLGGAGATSTMAAGAGGAGAGGGGGSANGGFQGNAYTLPGGNGGFGGGGGGGGYGLVNGIPASGGAGGFGGGGGGSGGDGNNLAVAEGTGGEGGEFAGRGGGSVSAGNIAGGGGGGAGLGGAIFALAGSVRLNGVSFSDCAAHRGVHGTNSSGNAGDGFGKGGALFLAAGVDAKAFGLTFARDVADDSMNQGYVEGQAVDTLDVYGLIDTLDSIFADGFDY